MKRQIVVYSHNKILLTNKIQGTNKSNNMDIAQKPMSEKKPKNANNSMLMLKSRQN